MRLITLCVICLMKIFEKFTHSFILHLITRCAQESEIYGSQKEQKQVLEREPGTSPVQFVCHFIKLCCIPYQNRCYKHIGKLISLTVSLKTVIACFSAVS